MNTIINTEAYPPVQRRNPAVERKIVRARLFAAVEGTKGMVFPTAPHQSPLPQMARVSR